MRSLVLPLAIVASTAAAYELRHDSQGDVVRWRREVVFVVPSTFSAALGEPRAGAAVRAAIDEIQAATPELDVRLVEGSPIGVGYRLDGSPNQNEIVTVADWPYTDNALASTIVTINARTNEILDTDIAFNVEQHLFRVLEGPGPFARDIDDVQNTLTHELGHALGLMHNDHDELVVMFPRASAGETSKRVLRDDDRDGLAELYGAAWEGDVAPPVRGCSSSGGGLTWLLALALLPLVFMARRPVRVTAPRRAPGRRALLGVLGAVGVASVSTSANAQSAPEPIGIVTVRAAVASRSPTSPGLIVTSLEVEPDGCVRASCEPVRRLTVPGGRLGELEQVVEHHPVPKLGERLGVAKRKGRLVIFRLADPAQAERFDALSRSARPQVSEPAPASPTQPVVPAMPARWHLP